MHTDPRFEQIRSLIQSNHFVEALDQIRKLEALGESAPEIVYAKGLCFARLGRASEARVVARHLKEEGHVALAQQLAKRITVEEPPQGLIDDEPHEFVVPPYPVQSQSSKGLVMAALAAGAVIVLVVGIALGAQLSKNAYPSDSSGAEHSKTVAAKQGELAPSQPQPAVQTAGAAADLTGVWQSVDFVKDVSAFKPGETQFRGDLVIKDFTCYSDGSSSRSMRWRDGWITDNASQIRAEYFVQNVGGETYLFLPWISGDVTIRGQKPQFYVMRKAATALAANDQQTPVPGQVTAQQPATQQAATQWVQGSLDITGSWRSVDFVRDPAQFRPGSKSWRGDLFLKDLQCNADGSASKQMTWGNGWITDLNSQYKAQYDVWMANGQTYLFFPWISGDVTLRGQKPQYYVLQRM